ncbi:MAG: hypothetical protein HGA22_10775 [Clostridiales bacterium]|nr:hypothetical protein [Clostridiales bacterium]
MILFGHIGIPLKALQIIRTKTPAMENKFIRELDYRIFLVGALLPDLIDKPLYFCFRDLVGTSQFIGHTLVFLLVLLAAGLFFDKKLCRPALLTLAAGVFSHQALDFIVMNYTNFLWPVFGFDFVHSQAADMTLANRLINHITSPYYLIGELIGLPIVLCYFLDYIKKRTVK